MKSVLLGVFVFLIFSIFSQQTNDIKSRASGTWDGNIWQRFNGSSWVNYSGAPASGANVEVMHDVVVSSQNQTASTSFTGNLKVTAGTFTILDRNGTNFIHTFILNGNFELNGGNLRYVRTNSNPAGRFHVSGDVKLINGNIVDGTGNSSSVANSGFFLIGAAGTTQTIEIGIPSSNFNGLENKFFVLSNGSNIIEKYSGTASQVTISGETPSIGSGFIAWLINRLKEQNQLH